MSTPTFVFDPQTDTIDSKADEIAAALPALNGRSRNRTLARTDVVDLLNLIVDHPNCQAARSYSAGSFVPNAYKWRAEIAAASATRREDGAYCVSLGWHDAHRSYGAGHHLTVDGRGA